VTVCRLSRQAVADWREIGRFTQMRWGIAQRRKYLAKMEATLRLLAQNPEMGMQREELLPGYRSMRIGRHIAYYRHAPGGIEVIRILHERMDAALHLTGEAAETAEEPE
jgi:toxin ParE1/3/4